MVKSPLPVKPKQLKQRKVKKETENKKKKARYACKKKRCAGKVTRKNIINQIVREIRIMKHSIVELKRAKKKELNMIERERWGKICRVKSQICVTNRKRRIQN